MEFWWQVTLRLLDGFKITCLIFAVTLAAALPLGLALSFGSMSKFRPLRYLSKIFVWMIRGTPLLLQVIIVYYSPSLVFGLDISYEYRLYAVFIAFIINYSCYFSEVYRGGIESISQSQSEAGQVLGMTKPQIFFRVILLQVIKRIIPPMSNEIITLVKDTALARVIVVMEIIKVADEYAASQALIWPLFYTMVFYLIFVGMLTLAFGYIEKRLSYFAA